MSLVRVAMLEVRQEMKLLLAQLVFCCVVQDLVLCKPRISL